MRLKSMILLVVASGCGLLAMFLFQQATKGNTSTVEQKVQILVAKAEMRPGEQLSELNVDFREYPISVVPDNAVTAKEEYEGKAVMVRTFRGDFVTLDKITSDLGVSNAIPSGMVAIGIPVDATTTLSGLIGPGDRIDVFVTFTMRAAYGSGKVVKNVLEFVEIFATDQKRQIDSQQNEKTKIVSLLVTPEQASLLKLAQDVGTLHVALRSKHDAAPRTAEGDKFTLDTVNGFYARDSEEGSEGGEEPAKSDDDLGSFLDSSAGDEPKETPIVNLSLPFMDSTPKTWQIEIFAGEDRQIAEVPLIEPEADTPTVDENESKNPLVNVFRKLLGGSKDAAKKTDTPTSPVTLPEPVTVQ